MGIIGNAIKNFIGNGINSLASNVGTIASGIVGHNIGLSKAEKQQNAFNASQAQLNRDFQKEMSDTSYQRAVADMNAAGLNPQMMYGNVSNGASTPSGSSASSGGYANRGLIAMQTSIQLRKSLADVKLAEAEAKLKQIEANYAPEKILAEIDGLRASAKSDMAKVGLTLAETTYQNVQNEYERNIIGLNIQLKSSEVILTKEQTRNVNIASGLLALQQITETKKWSEIDASVKELLSRNGVNEANYDYLVERTKEVSSQIEVNESVKDVNQKQSALINSQYIANKIKNDKAFKKPSEDASKVEKFAYSWYRGFDNLCETFGKVIHGNISGSVTESNSTSHSTNTNTNHSTNTSRSFNVNETTINGNRF